MRGLMRGNVITLRDFKGERPETGAGQIEDTEFRSIINFMVTNKGTLKSRRGVRHESGNLAVRQGSIIGLWLTAASVERLVINSPISGTHFADAAGANVTNPSAIESHLILNQNNLAYLFRDTTTNIRTYDGTTLTTTGVSGVQANLGLVFKSRMFVGNNSASGTPRSQLRYSDIFDLNAPNTVGGWPSLNTLDFQSTDGDFITAVAVLNDVLIVFKRFSTWAVYVEGSPPWTIRNVHPSIGCIGRDTAVVIGGLLYFRSAVGVYRTDGTTFERISDPVKEFFDAQPPMTPAACNLRNAVWWGDYYILNDPNTATAENSTWHVYNIENGAWTTFFIESSQIYRLFLYPSYSPPRISAVEYIPGAATGKMLKFEELNLHGDGDGSVDLDCSISSKEYVFDKPADYKLIRELAVEVDKITSPSSSITMRCVVSNEVASLATQVKTLNTDRATIFRFRGPMRCRVMDFSLTLDDITTDVEISAISFDMGLVGRVGNAH